MTTEQRCSGCKAPLIHKDEIEFGRCEQCLERDHERAQRRREWGHYHPGTPIPKSELEG